MKILFIAFALMLVGCNTPNQTAVPASTVTASATSQQRAETATVTTIPSATVTVQVTSITTPSVTPSATAPLQSTTTATLSSTPPLVFSTATPTATPVDPQQQCNQLGSSAKPGLYVISIQPVPELVWDNEPRRFDVSICNTLGVATLNSLRFVVRIYYATQVRPVGQTAEVMAQLVPGVNELKFESWTPGLRNHITACQQQPPVQVEVNYIVPPDLSALRVMPFPDGTNRRTLGVKCGGTFP
ncbi:MAG: hypothetical protein HZB51_30965 [Chloroflexi bacterium]|nr:hypothetical protein [Chloroflexota bacterium]